LGQSSNQQQQTVPGVRIDLSNVRGTTRFNDLLEDLQRDISKYDDVIQAQIRLKNECDAIMNSHGSQLSQVPNDVEFCRRKLIGVENAADSDVQAISLAQKLVKTDAEHAKLSFKAIDNLKLPPQYHNSNVWSSQSNVSGSQNNGDAEAQDIVGFFSATADEIASTLSSYQKHMIEIEQHLRNVEASSVAQQSEVLARKNGATLGQDDPMEQLTGALMEFESGLLGVASRVGGAREGLQSLQLGQFTSQPSAPSGYRSRNGVY
jgi:nucleoporin p58/p45